MTNTSLTWIRAAQQDRSQKTLERLLNATEELLEDRSFDAISVQHIVKKARSSIGSFYARFGDKTALLHTLHQRFCADILETSQQFQPELLGGANLRSLVEAFCDLMLVDIRQRPGLRRAFLLVRSQDPHFQSRTQAVEHHLLTLLETLLSDVREQIAHEDLTEATRFAFELANSLAEYRLLYSQEPDFGPAFRDEMVRAIYSYLNQPAS